MYVYSYLNELQEEPVTMKVRRNGEEKTFTYTPDVSVRYLLGFNRSDTDSMEILSLIEGMPLEAAGLQEGDVITSINGTRIPDGKAYENYIKEHPLSDKEVEITYERDGLEYSAENHPEGIQNPDSRIFLQYGIYQGRGLSGFEICGSGYKIYDPYYPSES